MKTNGKDIRAILITPHTEGCGYAVPLVEVVGKATESDGVVHGSVLGCYANNGYASVRTANCNNHAGNGNGNYAGSWSLAKDITLGHTSLPAREKITEGSATTGAQGQCDYESLPYWGEDSAESNASLSVREDVFEQIREANRKRKLKSLKKYLTDIRVIGAAFDRTMERSHSCKQEIAKWRSRKEEVCQCIQHELLTQTYHPQPTMPREIKPKGKGGKVRHAEVSAMYDRIVVNVFYIVIEQKFKAMLIRNVYSGIDRRSILSNDKRYCMINVIRHWAQTHTDSYVGQTDIRHFYESLQIKVVIGIMFKTIICPFARWMLLRMFERLDIVPIGGSLSQLMAMIAVNECDREILRKYHVFLCCFGDNRLIGGDKRKFRDLEEHSTVIPYDYKIFESHAGKTDGEGKAKYYVDVTYIYISANGCKRLYHSTEGSEEIVGFFRLVEDGKVELRQTMHVGHQGTQSYFEEYHTTKEEACEIICRELGII